MLKFLVKKCYEIFYYFFYFLATLYTILSRRCFRVHKGKQTYGTGLQHNILIIFFFAMTLHKSKFVSFVQVHKQVVVIHPDIFNYYYKVTQVSRLQFCSTRSNSSPRCEILKSVFSVSCNSKYKRLEQFFGTI